MTRITLVILALCAACDPQAEAGGNGFGGSDEQLSRAGESCGTTIHCIAGLRCVDQVCRPAEASVLGDFYAAAGDLAMTRGDSDAAIEQYTEAVNQYEADKLEPPPRVYCAQGKALTQRRDDPVRAELAARVLHRCLLGSPPGSRQRAAALADLALLREVGLDPLLLARDEPADKYLTKEPLAPPVDDLKVTVKVEGREPRSRSFAGWLEQLKTPEVRAALIPCWKQHLKVTREPALAGTLAFAYSSKFDEYDDFDRGVLDIAEVAATDDAGKAVACMRTALLPLADAYSRTAGESSWRASLAISIAE